MQTLQEARPNVKTVMAFVVMFQAQRNEVAWQQGHQAALTGQLPEATKLYEVCSQEWNAYADGYNAGMALARRTEFLAGLVL